MYCGEVYVGDRSIVDSLIVDIECDPYWQHGLALIVVQNFHFQFFHVFQMI